MRILILVLILLLTGCSNEMTDSNNKIKVENLKPFRANSGEFMDETMAIEIVKKDMPNTLEIGDHQVDILETQLPTKDQPYWTIELKDIISNKKYMYNLDGFTGEVLGVTMEDQHEIDEEKSKKEMEEFVVWTFENWQNFSSEDYDPSKYGLAFTLNFRLPYIFDNFEENTEKVKSQNIESTVKVEEVKDVAAVFNEEDHTIYGQVRLVADYSQRINGEKINEKVEVLIFSKNILERDEGWQITNVDMYPIEEDSENFNQLFFGFEKTMD